MAVAFTLTREVLGYELPRMRERLAAALRVGERPLEHGALELRQPAPASFASSITSGG